MSEIAACVDKFAVAKRLHAENMQHQQLPDQVDDSVFRTGCSASKQDTNWNLDRENLAAAKIEDCMYGHELGCKKPETRMDLAIGWETPIDPVYEPHRTKHIDGSEIFDIIGSVSKNRELLSRSEKKDRCVCTSQDEMEKDSRKNRCCCDRPCNVLTIYASKEKDRRVFHPLKVKTGTYKKIRVPYFYLYNNILKARQDRRGIPRDLFLKCFNHVFRYSSVNGNYKIIE